VQALAAHQDRRCRLESRAVLALDDGKGPDAKYRIGESARIVLGDQVPGTSRAFDIIEIEMEKYLSALWSFCHLRTLDHLNDIVMDHVHASGERARGGFKH
jgi:hypothetical protein